MVLEKVDDKGFSRDDLIGCLYSGSGQRVGKIYLPDKRVSPGDNAGLRVVILNIL